MISLNRGRKIMTVFIFLNSDAGQCGFYGDHYKHTKGKGDRVACANGGYSIARWAGIKPDLVVGDLDSLDREDIEEDIEVVTYPAEKDFSDFELTLKNVEPLRPDRIFVYGALGGRADHELTNILLLVKSPTPMIIIEETTEIYNVRGSLLLEEKKGCVCSLLALCGPCHVEEMRGFRYVLQDEDLAPSSRGLSNVIVEKVASISIGNGSLAVILTN
jgi:thiamine pyrophosphokinase